MSGNNYSFASSFTFDHELTYAGTSSGSEDRNYHELDRNAVQYYIHDDDTLEVTSEVSRSLPALHEQKEWNYDDSEVIGNVNEAVNNDTPMKLDGIEKMQGRSIIAIMKNLEENMVQTSQWTFDLTDYNLTILNGDGLSPKKASDVENFKNAFLEVKNCPVAGRGCFAVCDLEAYRPVLVEKELFHGYAGILPKKLDGLTQEQRRAYLGLQGRLESPNEDICMAIWRSNAFDIEGGGSIFLVGSRFSRASNPHSNVEYSFDQKKRCMLFVTKKAIKAGDELLIDYSSAYHGDEFDYRSFNCKCGGCTSTTGSEAITSTERHEDEFDDDDFGVVGHFEFDAHGFNGINF